VVNDTTLSAASIRHSGKSGGWTCQLAPDERIPSDSWAIDPGLFGMYVCTTRHDQEVRYAQVMWHVQKFAARKWLTPGPSEDQLWPITFKDDGSTDYAFVLSGVWNIADMSQAARELRYDDAYYHEDTYPHAEGAKRRVGTAHRPGGSYRTFRAEYLG
jgi:hypothetical protein